MEINSNPTSTIILEILKKLDIAQPFIQGLRCTTVAWGAIFSCSPACAERRCELRVVVCISE